VEVRSVYILLTYSNQHDVQGHIAVVLHAYSSKVEDQYATFHFRLNSFPQRDAMLRFATHAVCLVTPSFILLYIVACATELMPKVKSAFCLGLDD